MTTDIANSRWQNGSITPSIGVTINFREELQSQEHFVHSAWWSRFERSNNINVQKKGPDYYEWQLTNVFPKMLHQSFSEHFGNWYTEPPVAGSSKTPIQFAFRVSGIRYGTLSFDLGIGGLTSIAKLLDHNFDLFKMLTETYVPQAFSYTFDLLSEPEKASSLVFSYTPSQSIAEAFTNLSPLTLPSSLPISPTSPPPQTSEHEEKLKWFWLVSNFSLVVPVLLSLLVLWVFLNANERLASRELDLTRLLVEQQKAFIEAQTKRNREIESLTLDILNGIATSPRSRERVAKVP